jgi:hypothetical protein
MREAQAAAAEAARSDAATAAQVHQNYEDDTGWTERQIQLELQRQPGERTIPIHDHICLKEFMSLVGLLTTEDRCMVTCARCG